LPFAFEKLHVYQRAVDFADAASALTESFPRGYGYLADQLNRVSLDRGEHRRGQRPFHPTRPPPFLHHRPPFAHRTQGSLNPATRWCP